MMDKTEETIQELTDQISEMKRAGDNEGVLDLQIRTGSVYLDYGNAPKALTHFEEGIKLAEELGADIDLARLFGMKGLALIRIGNPKQAMQAFNKSRKTAEKIGHIPITIDAYTQIGKLQYETGEIEKGIKNLEKAYRTSFENGDKQREMYIAGVMGRVFLVMEQQGKALEFFSIALDTAQELGRKESESQYQIAAGHVYLITKDFGPAEEHFKNALDIGTRLKDPKIQLLAFESLFQLSIQVDDVGAVLFNGEQTLRIAKEIEDIGAEAENIRRMAHYLFEKGDHERAIPFLERGLEIGQAIHDKNFQMDMLAQLGLAQYFFENLEKAEELLFEAYQLATQMQKPLELAQIGGKLSVVKAERGELEAAIKYAQEAVQVAEAQNLPLLRGEQLVLLAMNYLDLDKQEEAREHLNKAVALYRELGQEDMLEQAELLLESIR